MKFEIETFVAERLKPLGGEWYRGRYWPATEEHIAQVEETVGFALPAAYREYLLSTGIAAPRTTLVFRPLGADYRIFLNVLYGQDPDRAGYSVADLAGLVIIGVSQTGALYLDQDGAVLYEQNSKAGVDKVADSFVAFLSGLEEDDD